MDVIEVSEDQRLIVSLDGNEVAGMLNTLYHAIQAVRAEQFQAVVGMEKSELSTIREQLKEVYPQVRKS